MISDELNPVYSLAEAAQKGQPASQISEVAWRVQQGYKISDPVRLLTLYDDSIRSGKMKLHSWQVKVMLKFAYGRVPEQVLRMVIRANNGSGKSKYCIAPCAIWLCMAHHRARAVVTSSSGVQLDRQSGASIVRIAQMVNETHGQILWKINYRFLTFLPTGSTIELYATDDPGKAEGYHPHEDGAEFALFVDEGKSVAENIYEAILRCNGMTRRMDVSSPGGLRGHFYSVNFSDRWIKFVVTYKECPHIKEDEVSEAKERFGENSPWFRSAYMAEFTSIEEDLVISWEQIQKCLRAAIQMPLIAGKKFGGLDLAAGGDENVLSVWKGNVQLALECFRCDDTVEGVEHIKKLIIQHEIDPKEIYADDGGVGKSMVDMLWRDGFQVNRVLNQSAAFNTELYSNLGAEMWFNFARLVQENEIVLMPDQTQILQLSSRYYKKGDVLGKIALESKRIARSKGHGSPDRADATVLAFANKSYPLAKYLSSRDVEQIRKPSTEQLIEEITRQRNAYSGIDAMLSGGGNSNSNNAVVDYGEIALTR